MLTFVFEISGCKNLESRQKTRLFASANYLACVIRFPSRLVSFSLRLTSMIFESSRQPLLHLLHFRAKWVFGVQVRSLRAGRWSPALLVPPSTRKSRHFGKDQKRETSSNCGTQAPICQGTTVYYAKRRLRPNLKGNIFDLQSRHEMFCD